MVETQATGVGEWIVIGAMALIMVGVGVWVWRLSRRVDELERKAGGNGG